MSAGRGINAPWWVKVFVPLHILAITSWSLPRPPSEYLGNPPQKRLGIETESPRRFLESAAETVRYSLLVANERYGKDSPLKFYVLSTGFWQYWDMFSPNPVYIDQYCDAVITYRDGRKAVYRYPRMFTLSLGRKFLQERWRKFFERVGDERYRFLWIPFSRRIALVNWQDRANPPVRIELHRHTMVVRPPGEPQNTEYADSVFYTYHLGAAEIAQLRAAKGF